MNQKKITFLLILFITVSIISCKNEESNTKKTESQIDDRNELVSEDTGHKQAKLMYKIFNNNEEEFKELIIALDSLRDKITIKIKKSKLEYNKIGSIFQKSPKQFSFNCVAPYTLVDSSDSHKIEVMLFSSFNAIYGDLVIGLNGKYGEKLKLIEKTEDYYDFLKKDKLIEAGYIITKTIGSNIIEIQLMHNFSDKSKQNNNTNYVFKLTGKDYHLECICPLHLLDEKQTQM